MKSRNPKVRPSGRWLRVLNMVSLILAGETIFLPAFHLGRYFKSSLLETFSIDEFQLGKLGAIYGFFATASYFLGGPLADRWPPRRLLTLSLVVTAMGSLYMATLPGFSGLCMVFAFWGVSTILAFWAPLIKATRDWAGPNGQAEAFGILDGGRGLASAGIASGAAFAFSMMVGSGEILDTNAQTRAVQRLVLSYAIYCIVAAACVWLFVPELDQPELDQSGANNEQPRRHIHLGIRLAIVLRSPVIWLQAVIIIAAYSAFKMLDNYGLYAEDVYGLSKADSANLVANASYIRVASALAAGWVADRWLGVRATIQCCFGLLLLAYAGFLLITPTRDMVWLLSANVAISCIGFFSLRGIYFALLEDSGIPRRLTGTAVGIISFVGYTPEIYMGPLTGWLIREARAEGDVLDGYRLIFIVLTGLCCCGVLATFALRWFRRKPSSRPVSSGN